MLYTSSEDQSQATPLQNYQSTSQIVSSTGSFSDVFTSENRGFSAAQVSQTETSSSKPKIESLPFGYQFAEVETAIANFTKHQPFNHHYAPNVNVNRNHNNHHHHHHNNTNGNNSNNNNNNNNNNRFNNYNHNNGRFHHKQQQQFSINAQLKQQQQQHFINNNAQQLNRYAQLNNNNSVQQHQSQHNGLLQSQVQQYNQLQHSGSINYQQQLPQHHLQGLTLNGSGIMNSSPDFKFDSYQSVQQPQFTHSDLINPVRDTSPSFTSPTTRPGSNGFGSSIDQINSPTSSFGLGGSGFLNTPLTNASSANGDIGVENSISLDDSNTYLGDIWGNSKSGLRNSASVWA